MDYKDLTPEMRDRVKACKSGRELAELANSIGYELTEDELGTIAGGDGINWACLSEGRDDCIRDQIYD